MPRVASIAVCAVLTLTRVSSEVAASEIELHELYYCELAEFTGSGGNPTKQVDMADFTPFGLSRMSRPGETNRFGFGSSTTNSIGIGKQQDDGRWVIRDWSEQVQTEPKITLVTFFPNKRILVSIFAGQGSHVSFGGECELRELPKQ